MEMVENMSVGTATKPRPIRRRAPWARLPTEPHARRVERLRRAFQRELGRKLTLIEKTAVFKAAVLTAKAEAAALDPRTTVEELVKLTNIADRAVQRLPRQTEPPKLPLGLLRARARWDAQAQPSENNSKAANAVRRETKPHASSKRERPRGDEAKTTD